MNLEYGKLATFVLVIASMTALTVHGDIPVAVCVSVVLSIAGYTAGNGHLAWRNKAPQPLLGRMVTIAGDDLLAALRQLLADSSTAPAPATATAAVPAPSPALSPEVNAVLTALAQLVHPPAPVGG